MIYLLDHQKERQEQIYKANFYLPTYKNIIKPIYSKIELQSNINALLTIGDFPNINCFLLHLSFREGKLADEVTQIAKEQKIPIAIFTNEPTEPVGFTQNHDRYLRLTSKQFYDKLKAFLEYYQVYEKINLGTLFYSDELKERLLPLINNFKRLFISKDNDEFIALPEIRMEKDLETIFRLLNKDSEFDDFIDEINDNKITKYSFFQKIT